MIQNQQIDNLQEKASRIKLFAFDVDGVLTNGEIIYTDKGEEIKVFNAKDGQGINLMVQNGFVTAIITARETPIVVKRGKDLGIHEVYKGCKPKTGAFQELMQKYNLEPSEVAYVGDDLPDLCILEQVGLAFCPYDAVEEVKQVCHFISSKEGGKGAVREITDFLLKNRVQEKVGI